MQRFVGTNKKRKYILKERNVSSENLINLSLSKIWCDGEQIQPRIYDFLLFFHKFHSKSPNTFFIPTSV